MLSRAEKGRDEISVRDSARGAYKGFFARIKFSVDNYKTEKDIVRMRDEFNRDFPQLYREFRTTQYSGKTTTPEFAQSLYNFLRKKHEENTLRIKELLKKYPDY
jgi:hypothetical protein